MKSAKISAEKSAATAKSPEKAPTDSPAHDSSWQVFLSVVLFAANISVRVYCGLYMIIADCDETYNYWEPLNLVFRGFGKQTWEYSPAYAIRSYAYLIPYYLATSPLRDFVHLTSSQFPPYAYFYAIRVVALCGFTAFTELKLHRSIRRCYGVYVANWYLLFSTFAPGMSHAGVALLPSSFAMAWVTWGSASALSATTPKNDVSVVRPTTHAIFCFVVAGFVGWPFALALGVPFGLFTVATRFQTTPLVRIVLFCSAIVVAITALLLCVDSYFYGRDFLFVPVNIVLYNVFALEGEGPEIFGVEPFSYYAKNLFLNFNVVFVLGYLGVFLNNVFSAQKLRSLVCASLPLLLWSTIFGRQPHKEERFLYPIYPLICVSAAILTSRAFEVVRSKTGTRVFVRVVSVLSMVSYITVSVLRILNLVNNYSAPLTTAHALYEDSILSGQNSNVDGGLKNVCVGREWYHFPTSFFLPDNYRLRFVQSGFDGLLPGDFPENTSLRAAASAYPSGMNSKNEFSLDKIIPFSECDYYIDNSLPVDTTTGEPSVVSRTDGELQVDNDWEVLRCEGILRPEGNHNAIGRLLYVPEFARAFVPYTVEQMDYCVLKRK
ncbi:hypothetical protein JCM33374_g2012 [Metschnikowia sp. JCM 33374]|nr:hypothetical protein JCM33374_g2012 [Metschnikowia sp. JCM 33374]